MRIKDVSYELSRVDTLEAVSSDQKELKNPEDAGGAPFGFEFISEGKTCNIAGGLTNSDLTLSVKLQSAEVLLFVGRIDPGYPAVFSVLLSPNSHLSIHLNV